MEETIAAPAARDLTDRRRGAVAAGLGGALLGWLLAAPMEATFSGPGPVELPYVPDSWAPAYDAVFSTVGEPLGLTEYYFWGKLAFLMYVAGLVVARALPDGACRRSRLGKRLLIIAFALGLVGDVVGYWGGWGSDEMTLLTDIGFVALEVPAMLLMLVSLVVLGFGLRRDGLRPAWVPWLLVAAVVLVPLFNATLIGYAPHGVLVPVLVLLAVVVAAARPGVREPAGTASASGSAGPDRLPG